MEGHEVTGSVGPGVAAWAQVLRGVAGPVGHIVAGGTADRVDQSQLESHTILWQVEQFIPSINLNFSLTQADKKVRLSPWGGRRLGPGW